MRYLITIFIVIFIFSCSKENKNQSYSFYHWKSKALMPSTLENKLDTTLDQVYLHYFDIDLNEQYNSIRPKYVLSAVDDWYKEQQITPVVYITNRAMLKAKDPSYLVKQIHALVQEISNHHFGKELPNLQIDCDWTGRTKTQYFQLLKLLKKYYTLSVTIRLHQIKYPKETGVPPVNTGILMLYNMGELSNMEENSIINTETVQSYVNKNLSYPMDLDLALPLYSQTVIKNKLGKVKLLNYIPESLADTNIFSSIGENLYLPKKDTLYHGFYISPGYQLKTEKVTSDVLLESIQILKKSRLNFQSIIYYHLEEKNLENYNISKISSTL